jgi:hypothetical protein
LNRKIAKKYKKEANELAATKKWRDIHKIWAEYKGKARKEAVGNFRLKTGHDCLAAHLRKTGIYESSECTICQMPNSVMDEEHLLHCPKLDTDQQVLKNTIKLYWDARQMTRKLLHYLPQEQQQRLATHASLQKTLGSASATPYLVHV